MMSGGEYGRVLAVPNGIANQVYSQRIYSVYPKASVLIYCLQGLVPE